MQKREDTHIYSGFSPEKVAEDLKPLVDFQDDGISLEVLNGLLEKHLLPHLMKYDLPAFQSMFNTYPEEGAESGAKVALKFNQGVTNWQVSPGGAMLEELCCKALCRLFGFDEGADATFMYCGTYANQQALYLALHTKAQDMGFNFEEIGLSGFKNPDNLVVLTSVDAHFSLKHAVRILGLGENSLKKVPVDKNRRIDVKNLRKTVESLKGEKEIFCVTATAGTTSTGSVDPISEIVELCREFNIWLHVDGAYGFAYSLVPEWKHLFAGSELADSVSWDPHKQFGVPIPSSVLFLKRKEDFNRMTLFSDYFNREEDTEPNPGMKSPPSTRPFSALPLVTSIKYQGLKKVIERLRAPLETVKTVYERLKEDPEIELFHEPDTGVLCFRVYPAGVPENKLDSLQKYIFNSIMNEGKRSISMTKLDQKQVLRIVAVSPAVTSEAVLDTISNVREIAKLYNFSG